MKKTASKSKFIEQKNRFLAYFFKNKFKAILEILIIVVYFAFALLLPTTSYTRFHLIPFFAAGLMIVLMLMWLILYGKIYLDFPTIMMFLFLIFNVFSWMINGFNYFNQTVVILPILFLFIYQYLKNTKNIKLFSYLTFLGYLFFAIVFSVFYARELIDFVLGKVGDTARLGEAFGNVNGIGGFFAIGFAFSLYYGIIAKRYHNLVFSALLLFLSATTGSKTAIMLVVVSLVVVMIVKFGLKKWYITISIIVAFLVLVVIVLSIPQFSFLKDRIVKMFQVLIGTSGSQVDGSTASRLTMVSEGLFGFLQRPIFGWGHNGFNKHITYYGTYSHNNYIELLSDYGLVGFLTFESIIFVPLFKYFTRKPPIDRENEGEGKRLVSLMVILGIFVFFAQFVGVGSVSKEHYILFAFLSVISTDYYEKKRKNAVYIPLATRNLFSKIKFLEIREAPLSGFEARITSLRNSRDVLKDKFVNAKVYFLQTMKLIGNKDNKILVVHRKEKEKKIKTSNPSTIVVPIKKMNKKDKVLNSAFVIFLSIQGSLAFSFSFYNDKAQLLNNAIEIANREQIKNSDPFVSFKDIKKNNTYLDALSKQKQEKEDYQTLNPYIQFDKQSFSYNMQSFYLTGVTVADLNPSGVLLKGIDLPIIFKEYDLTPLNGADYAVMITSKTALSLLDAGATDFESLKGQTFVDQNSKTYSINNIIYNDEVAVVDSITTNIYNAETTGLSDHLTKLNGDYILYITKPNELVSSFEHCFAYFPIGTELIEYIDKTYENYGVRANIEDVLQFYTLNEEGEYFLNENYSNINIVYVVYGQNANQIYQILLTIISIILYVISFVITFDLAKKSRDNKFLYLAFGISFVISFLPLILIRLLSADFQIRVLASNAAFIYLAITTAMLFILLLVQNIIHRVKNKKNKED